MADPTAIDIAVRLRAELLRNEREAALRLVRAYGASYQRLLPAIDALDAEIAAMDARGEVTAAQVAKLGRLKSLRRQVDAEIQRFIPILQNETEQGIRDAIDMAQSHAPQVVQAALPGVGAVDAQIMARFQRLNPAAVEALLGFTDPRSPLMRGMLTAYPDVAQGVADALVQGLALGYNPRKVARIVQREFGVGLDSALRTTRTAQLNAYREATRATWLANPGIVKGWEWYATRDSRTCMSCIAMDGTKHKPTEQLNDHWNGRCVAIPITATYRDLGIAVDMPRNEQPTAAQWFTEQDEGTQRQMMGKGKYELWRSGSLRLADLTTTANDPVWGPMRVETTLAALTPAA